MKNNKKVVVGFSGGVDSATVVKILKEKGYEPVAVFLKMFPGKNLDEIRALAGKLGVELIVKDISNIFSGCIIKDFLDEYQNNRTPNPCVKCNFEIKFKTLLEVADELRIEKVATGHYAQIRACSESLNDGIFKLFKGQDQKKDQSYFLYRLTQKELARIIFPLGEKQKENIKKEALENKWFDEIKESQNVCFLAEEEKVQDFLKKNLNTSENKPGDIENEKGEVLGKHQGLACYTQGQRKGLDLSGGPLYVIGKDLVRNILLISENKEHPALMNKEIYLEQVNWISGEPEEEKIYQCKSRYRIQSSLGKIVKEKDNWRIILENPQWAVAEGQSMVVYKKDEVMGGGIIKKVQ